MVQNLNQYPGSGIPTDPDMCVCMRFELDLASKNPFLLFRALLRCRCSGALFFVYNTVFFTAQKKGLALKKLINLWLF